MVETKNSSSKVVLILVILVAVLAGLLFFFAQQSCSASKNLVLIKQKLDTELTPIRKDIVDSKARDEILLEGQSKLNLALFGDEKTPGFIQKLDKSLEQSAALQEKLNQRPAPAKPESIKDLEQCQKEYLVLFDSYNLCLETNKSKDSTLKLFGKVKENLLKQVALLDGAVNELKSQVENYKKIEKKVTESMEKLDKVYRVNSFWKNVKNVGMGSIAGALAVVILKAVLK